MMICPFETLRPILFQHRIEPVTPEGLILSKIYKNQVRVDGGNRFTPTRATWVKSSAAEARRFSGGASTARRDTLWTLAGIPPGSP
jgi:hypothetical protein